MSTPATPVPAGWYPDPAGSPRSRWWDGSQWTEHFQDAAPAQPAPSAQHAYTQQPAYTQQSAQPTAPSDAPPYNAFVWIQIGLLAISLVSLLFLDLRAYMIDSMTGALSGDPSVMPLFPTGYFVIVGIGWLVYALSVVTSFLDYRQIVRTGVQRPFHWAWSFLSVIVYLIGRAVIMKRRIGRGSLTLWVAIGYLVLSTIITIVIVAISVSAAMEFMPMR